ncbi:MAG: cbb3-type cytochrome oxidase assembly protein CcoS [Proteobacteria bacterium]|nr:cbb3-type cytochrome oxidase assembly protein CcoS [Pseudomonadota bacterium]
MYALIYLIPIAFLVVLLIAFGMIWSIHNDQFEDLEGAANSIFKEDVQDVKNIKAQKKSQI